MKRDLARQLAQLEVDTRDWPEWRRRAAAEDFPVDCTDVQVSPVPTEMRGALARDITSARIGSCDANNANNTPTRSSSRMAPPPARPSGPPARWPPGARLPRSTACRFGASVCTSPLRPSGCGSVARRGPNPETTLNPHRRGFSVVTYLVSLAPTKLREELARDITPASINPCQTAASKSPC